MLDFPNTPNDGDLHTENGTIWQWKATPGLWTVVQSGIPLEIVEANAPAGWQVWGDVLIQWGVSAVTDADGVTTVTFVQPFVGTNYTIGGAIGVGSGSVVADRTVNVGVLSATQAELKASRDGVPSQGVGIRWWAFGEAPDALKKPKTIQTVGGAVMREHHDPTGAMSWRIVGNTLEFWGTLTTAASPTTVNLSKTFANAAFIATASVVRGSVSGARVVYVANPGASPNSFQLFTGDTTAHQNTQVTWRAVGEWDGVS